MTAHTEAAPVGVHAVEAHTATPPASSHPVSSSSRHRAIGRAIADACKACGVCLLFLALTEAALRFAGVRLDASLFQIDPVRNYSFRPGATGWHTAENDIFVRINAQGNRDRLRSELAVPGTLRIAVLGSSTTAALEVEQPQTYSALLERKLSRPGAPVEVMNFAVEGYGAAQDFYTLHDQVWRFHPQIVMDEVSLKQYVLNSTRKYSTTSIPYPYFQVAGNGVTPDPSSAQLGRPTPRQVDRSNRMRTFVNSSEVLLLFTEVKKEAMLKLKALLPSKAGKGSFVDNPADDPWRWTLIPPPNADIEQGWQVLEGTTLAMRDEVEAHGAEFWVIASDDAFQVNPNPQVAATLQRKMHADTLEYGDRRFDSFLSAHHINHIHLEPALQAYVQSTGAYLHGGPKSVRGEGHWNALGHQVVASIVANDLERDSPRLERWETSSLNHAAPSSSGTAQVVQP